MIKELTTPNLEALEKITEDWARKFQEGTYGHKEAVFVQEMVKLLRATVTRNCNATSVAGRVVPETPPEATVEAPKGSWWPFGRKDK